MEQNHFGNFGRGRYDEHFCEIILNLDQWSEDDGVKIYTSYLDRWWQSCLAEWKQLGILAEDIMSNISVQLTQIRI